MLGAIIGDIAGAFHEFRSEKGYCLQPFVFGSSSFTDDSVLTVATAAKLLGKYDSFVEAYRSTYHQFKNLDSNGNGNIDMGYGDRFQRWANGSETKGYGSKGNGAAMRVSPIAYFARTKDEVISLAKESAEATHNTPEGVFSAQAVALAIYMSIQEESPEKIIKTIRGLSTETLGAKNPYLNVYDLHELNETYTFTALADKSVPQAITIGLSCKCFEEAIRMSLYIGGDTDTIASIACAIAEARFGIPPSNQAFGVPFKQHAGEYFEIAESFYNKFVEPVIADRPKTELTTWRYLAWWLTDKGMPLSRNLVGVEPL